MPNYYASYTDCSAPSNYYGMPIWAYVLLGGVGLGALITLGVAGAWAPGVAAFMATVCLAGIVLCSWWLNVRLICLGGNKTAIGAIYHLEPPTPTFNAFAFGDYDTDYSFNILLWPFLPTDTLPTSFTSEQWTANAIPDLIAAWPTLPPAIPVVPYAKTQVDLILAQYNTMGSLGLGFSGQPGGSQQFFLLHCEIEGPGMHDLRIMFFVLFALYIAAAALSLIPGVGTILSIILSFLAFLAFLFGGAAITHQDASPPSGDGFNGTLNAYDQATGPNSLVDVVYVFGRWSYDSLHDGWNEIHPLLYMVKLGEVSQGNLAKGDWVLPDLPGTKQRLDAQFSIIDSPAAAQTQAQPQNRWNLHPLLDGCLGAVPYPSPSPTPPIP